MKKRIEELEKEIALKKDISKVVAENNLEEPESVDKI